MMQFGKNLRKGRSIPFGVFALAISAGVVGLGLASISIGTIWSSQYSLTDVILLAIGLLDLIAAIGFFCLRKWAWWWAVINFWGLGFWMVFASVDVLAHFRETGDCCGPDKKMADLFVTFVCWPFLCYYLIRPRIRSLFGIGTGKTLS